MTSTVSSRTERSGGTKLARVETTKHVFVASAFEQNFSLKEVCKHYPDAKLTAQELTVDLGVDGQLYIYPFGAIVFHGAPPAVRDRELARLRGFYPELSVKVVSEELQVSEDPEGVSGAHEGTFSLARFTPGRASVMALTVAQSAAMEYYETIVEQLSVRTAVHVDRLERTGNVALRTRPLHRFIGEAISVRTEVLSVLHLLDKPDATWDDPAMDAIYEELQDHFDLQDRYDALASKLKSVQEALELVLDVARDARLVLLELTVVILIVIEIGVGILRH